MLILLMKKCTPRVTNQQNPYQTNQATADIYQNTNVNVKMTLVFFKIMFMT